MASIIKVDRILDSTETGKVDIPGGIDTDVLNATELIADTWKNVDGTENYKCKCWVNFDGTTTPPTIRASGNVSSVVRNGTGDYTVNFETSMEDANYSVAYNCVATAFGARAVNGLGTANSDKSSTSCRFVVGYPNLAGGNYIMENNNSMSVAIFR